MSSPADRVKMLSEMTRAEKAELLRWIVRDLADDFPGIESTPGVMGGVPCITRTRIPVWVLEQARRLGTSDADLLRDYPTLTVQDFANAWNFVRSHHSEINAQIEANETCSITQTCDATFDGRMFWPDPPVELEPNTRVCLTVEVKKIATRKTESFLEVAQSLNLEGPPDWTTRLD